MGIPIEGQSNIEISSNTPTEQPPTSAAQLPPEALDLASKLFDYARGGKTAELEQYVTAGIPPNLTDHKGNTLVMLAAYHGHADTVRMLLSKGADANATNDRGQTPIAGAVFKGHDDVVKVLFQEGKADIRGGHPNAVDSSIMFKRDAYLTMFGVTE